MPIAAPAKNAAWTPASLPGLTVWLRADMGITLNGSAVSAWADQSGNGNSVTQGSAGSQPGYSATGNPAGGPAVTFARTPQYMTSGAFTNISTGSVIVALTNTSDINGAIYNIFDSTLNTTNEWAAWYTGTGTALTLSIYAGSTKSSAAGAAEANDWYVLIVNFLGNSQSNAWFDGSEIVGPVNAGSLSFGQSGLIIGAAEQLGATGMQGAMTEFIVTSTPISAGNQSSYMAWALAHWGVD